jgi:hypothetical protein
MFRNVASDGFVLEDPENPHGLSQPGCVLASPSRENTGTDVNQDYVYNWTRDAAIVELARHERCSEERGEGMQPSGGLRRRLRPRGPGTSRSDTITAQAPLASGP